MNAVGLLPLSKYALVRSKPVCKFFWYFPYRCSLPASQVSEDFGMSQFWYDDDTATKIAEEAEKRSGGGGIAFLSCPTAFLQFKKMYPERENVGVAGV